MGEGWLRVCVCGGDAVLSYHGHDYAQLAEGFGLRQLEK